MSLSKALVARKKATLWFTGFTSEMTFSGKNRVFTFMLETPIDHVGSTRFNNLKTKVYNDVSQVKEAKFVKVMDTDLDKFEDEFLTEGKLGEADFKIKGYDGEGLLLDVSKPQFHSISGEIQRDSELWLKPQLFSETPRATMDRQRMD